MSIDVHKPRKIDDKDWNELENDYDIHKAILCNNCQTIVRLNKVIFISGNVHAYEKVNNKATDNTIRFSKVEKFYVRIGVCLHCYNQYFKKE